MSTLSLLPAPGELEFVSAASCAPGIVTYLRTRRRVVSCPECGTSTGRVHSRYVPTLSDLPWQGSAVRICLQTRRFFCPASAYRRRIFVERLPEAAVAHLASVVVRPQAPAATFRTMAGQVGGQVGAVGFPAKNEDRGHAMR